MQTDVRTMLLTASLFLIGCGVVETNPPVILDAGSEPPDQASGDAADPNPTDADATSTESDSGSAGTADMGTPPTDMANPTEPDMAPPPQPVCGDGEVEGGEECDDGNRANGDGCSAACQIEDGYVCSDAQPNVCSPAPSPGTGDGVCEPGYASDVYDPYPGNNGAYPIGDSDTYGWRGDDFESYADAELVESSTNKGRQSHLEVTSGALEARHINGSRLWKRGWTSTYNFRVLSRATSGGSKVRFTDVDVRARVYYRTWQSGGPAHSGAHLFARYQTENDLYVASLRKDGQVVIKRKYCDAYTTLAASAFSQGPVETETWYDLRFEVVGQRLRFYVDGKLEVEAFDETLSWGTTGVRTDYVDVYFDDWEHR